MITCRDYISMMFDTLAYCIDDCQYEGMTDAADPQPAACCVLVAPLDDEDAARLAGQLKALADPTRIKLVSMLATAPGGELCACDLPAALGKSQPTTSHHLHLLLDAGLVEREQRGKWAWFRLDRRGLAAIRHALGASGA
jgi:ArsR family transcriptional regulator